MTPLEITPQITNFADIPIEFWVAISIQIFILVFGIWAVVKLMKFLVISVPARVAQRFDANQKTTPAADPVPESIDDDFADIAEEMRREKNNA